MLPDCKASGYKTDTQGGYARAPFRGKLIAVTRIVYMQHYKLEPEDIEGKVIMHICDNPDCINIDHLQLGTQQDNVRDMWNKGRQGIVPMQGSKHPMAKINEDVVRAIKANRTMSGKSLAKRYGVSVATISMIRNGKIWTHVN